MGQVTVAVSFVSLLERIVSASDLLNPLYNYAKLEKGLVYVIVPSKVVLDSYLFSGYDPYIVAVSCAKAARKAVVFLARNKKVCVHDVNFARKERLRKGRDLYMIKWHEFDYIEKGVDRLDVDAFIGKEENKCVGVTVNLDFLQLLRDVVAKVKINVTPIECIKYGTDDYLAWFVVFGVGDGHPIDCISGDRATTIDGAKQSLAQKAILFFMPIYGFAIEDVTSHLIDMEEFAISVAREKYVQVKERVNGLKEELSPRAVLIVQDQLTPRGKKFAIPEPQCPLPPKKRKVVQNSGASSSNAVVIPDSVVMTELSLLSKDSKMQ